VGATDVVGVAAPVATAVGEDVLVLTCGGVTPQATNRIARDAARALIVSG
jgi:DNA-binding IclR family transcriptional regulator